LDVYQYKNGLNIIGEKLSNRHYFSNIDSILNFLDDGIYLREITLPKNDKDLKTKKIGTKKWISNKIILGKRYNLDKIET